MRQISPIEAALEYIESLERKPDRTDIDEWQLQGWKLYRNGIATTLDEALGLSVGPGQAREKLCYVWRTRERNRLIRDAAQKLKPTRGKVLTARTISYSMNHGVPSLGGPETWEASIVLVRLRQICMNYDGDSPLALGWRRTLEIMNGDGE